MISSRVKDISPFIVMEILEKAHEMERQGLSIIHLEIWNNRLLSRIRYLKF